MSLLTILFDELHGTSVEGRLFAEDASALSRETYAGGQLAGGFAQASALYASSVARITRAQLLIDVLKLATNAFEAHCAGEERFFSADYAEAEASFARAYAAIIAAIELIDHRGLSPNAKLSLLAKRYAEFFQIEMIEARGFGLRVQGKWPEALVVHEAEIRMSKLAAESAPVDDEKLNSFFRGHVWYAEASRLRVIAEQARAMGNVEEYSKNDTLALEAERMSEILNPQWGRLEEK